MESTLAPAWHEAGNPCQSTLLSWHPYPYWIFQAPSEAGKERPSSQLYCWGWGLGVDKDLLRLQTGDSTAEGLGLIPLLSTRLCAQGQGAERKKIKPKDQNSRPPSHFPALGSEWAHSSIAKSVSCNLEWFHLISQILWISLAECPLGRTPHFLEVEAMRKQCVSTSLVPWSQQTFLPPWSHLQIQLLQKTAPLHWLCAELAPALFEVFNATFNTSLHPLPGPWCLHRAAAQGLGLKLALCIVQGKENPADSAESHGIGVSTACSQSRAPHQQTQGTAAGSWRVDAWQGLFSWHLGYSEGWRWLHGIWPKRWENHRESLLPLTLPSWCLHTGKQEL